MNPIGNMPDHIGEPCDDCGVEDYWHPRAGCKKFISRIMIEVLKLAESSPEEELKLSCLNYMWHNSPTVEEAKPYLKSSDNEIEGFGIRVGFRAELRADKWVEEWFPQKPSIRLWDYLIELKLLPARTEI